MFCHVLRPLIQYMLSPFQGTDEKMFPGIRGGVKKILVFLTFGQKGGGAVSANPKNPYQKILRFLDALASLELGLSFNE